MTDRSDGKSDKSHENKDIPRRMTNKTRIVNSLSCCNLLLLLRSLDPHGNNFVIGPTRNEASAHGTRQASRLQREIH